MARRINRNRRPEGRPEGTEEFHELHDGAVKPQRKKRRIIGRFDIPVEAFGKLPRMEIVGNMEILIENHTGIIEYSSREVQVAARRKIIKITGDELSLDGMDADNLHIKGDISAIEFI